MQDKNIPALSRHEMGFLFIKFQQNKQNVALVHPKYLPCFLPHLSAGASCYRSGLCEPISDIQVRKTAVSEELVLRGSQPADLCCARIYTDT